MVKFKIDTDRFENWAVTCKELNIYLFMDSRREARIAKKALEMFYNDK